MDFTVNDRDVTLSHDERMIFDFLYSLASESKRFVSPTELGRTLKGGNYHSAWASPICLKMVKMGLLGRNKKGWYRIRKSVCDEFHGVESYYDGRDGNNY